MIRALSRLVLDGDGNVVSVHTACGATDGGTTNFPTFVSCPDCKTLPTPTPTTERPDTKKAPRR
jgi:hypothetical protein